MNKLKWNKKSTWLRTSAYLILCLMLLFSVVGAGIAENALADEDNTSPNPYIIRTFIDEQGREIAEVIFPGRPPEVKAAAVTVPESDPFMGTNTIPDVPAFDWCYGCSATSAAMMMGYYDNAGYSNMYAGPTNGGVCPMDNTAWGSGECSLSATHQGYDGLIPKGHVDDYWVSYGDPGPDPYFGNWTEHTHGDCTADYMGTSQSYYGSSDGSTWFYWDNSGDPLYDYTGCEPIPRRDGCHGTRLFAESRGYTVNTNYTQLIYEYPGTAPGKGFTFDNYKAQIDAGRPVIIQVEGHSMLGYGYNDIGSKVYLHDTWDHASHEMTWGGTYGSGMQHQAVTVLELAPLGPEPDILVDPTSFDVMLPPDTTWDGTLNIANTGGNNLICDISDYETTGMTAPAPTGEASGTTSSPSEHETGAVHEGIIQSPPSSEPPPPTGGFGAGYDDALKYDDGTAENGYAWTSGFEGNRFAVRFSPPSYPATPKTAWVHIWDGSGWPDGDHEQFEVEVWDDDGGGGAPGTMLGSTTTTATNWGWWSVDLSGMGITIPSGDFYVAYRQMTCEPDCEALSADEDAPHSGRAWLCDGGSWNLMSNWGYDLDWLLRCEVASDCPWLSESPSSGTIPPSGSQDVTVSFDTTGLAVGAYTADIVIASNDPDENPVTVPVTLHVVEPCEVLFEQAHSPAEWFMEGLYSDWASLLESQGMIVSSLNTGPVTAGALSGYDVVIICNPTDSYSTPEINAIKQYVNDGGGLFILGEWDSYMIGHGVTSNQIATEFGITFNNDSVHDSINNEGQTFWPLIGEFNNSVIGTDVAEAAYYCGCSLSPSGSAFPIAWAHSDAYVASPPPGATMGANSVEMGTMGTAVEIVTESSAAEMEAGEESATMAGAENQSAVAGSASSEPAEDLVVSGTGSIKTLAGDAESYFFTLADVIFFSYEDNTELELYNSASTLVWSGTLNKGEHHYQAVTTGAYKAVGSTGFAVLSGDPISSYVCGYYAMDENGYGASTELYTWVPEIWGHCSFVVFAYEDNTQVTVEYTDTGVDIATFTLNKGEHWQNESLSEQWLHVTANKPVSALTAYDQGYFVPSANKGFSGTEFYTYVSDIMGWAEDLSVMAFYDNTTVTIKNSDTGITIWSGTLNSGQSHVEGYPSGADLFFSITSSKTVTVSVQPWVSQTSAYHQGAYVPDSTGAGIGTDLIGSTLGGGYLYIFAYQDGSTVEVHNSQTGVLASTHNLDEGDYVQANPGNGLWRVTSNKPVSAYSGYGTWNADFAPVQFGEVVSTLQVTPDPATVNVCQSTSVEIMVKDYGLPVDNALVALSGCGVSESGYTNASGIVNLNVHATSEGTINVAASKDVKSGTAEIAAVSVPTVMAAAYYGSGRVAAVGDGNLFGNTDADGDLTMNLYDRDNEKVAVDIPQWLCGYGASPSQIDIPLEVGWNLVSLPLIPDNTDIDAVISDGNLASGDAANIALVYHYDNTAGIWMWWNGTLAGNLHTMEDGLGYWVYAIVDDTLTVHGTQAGHPGPDYPVLAGWEMIGFTSTSNMAPETYLASEDGNYSLLYRWFDGGWWWWMKNTPASTFTNMEPGYGYWLFMNADGTITPP